MGDTDIDWVGASYGVAVKRPSATDGVWYWVPDDYGIFPWELAAVESTGGDLSEEALMEIQAAVDHFRVLGGIDYSIKYEVSVRPFFRKESMDDDGPTIEVSFVDCEDHHPIKGRLF